MNQDSKRISHRTKYTRIRKMYYYTDNDVSNDGMTSHNNIIIFKVHNNS